MVSIVAIHGPGGHAYKTWTDEATKILWLRDLLPQQIPNARVITFGYPTESTFSATQYALSLLEDLNSLRRSTKVVFSVCRVPSRSHRQFALTRKTAPDRKSPAP
jgi:hypothetical protein